MHICHYKITMEQLLQWTGSKEDIIQAINNITTYNGITATTALEYAKNSFTGKAKNKHIVVFTDTEENQKSADIIKEIQDDQNLYMTAVIIGENANKQTEYKATKNTKVYQIEDSSNYNFDQLNYSNFRIHIFNSKKRNK